MKQVNKFINTRIYEKISDNTRIMSLINGCLPVDFSHHVECIGTSGQTLNLSADSAAISSQLRFYSDAMLTALHQEGMRGIRKIKVHTRTAAAKSGPAPSRPARWANPLSTETRELLQSTARTIDDERLSRALRKLAEVNGNNG